MEDGNRRIYGERWEDEMMNRVRMMNKLYIYMHSFIVKMKISSRVE